MAELDPRVEAGGTGQESTRQVGCRGQMRLVFRRLEARAEASIPALPGITACCTKARVCHADCCETFAVIFLALRLFFSSLRSSGGLRLFVLGRSPNHRRCQPSPILKT